MVNQRYQWNRAGQYPVYPTRLDNPPLSIPQTKTEAEEMAEIAIKYGVALIIFGFVLSVLLRT